MPDPLVVANKLVKTNLFRKAVRVDRVACMRFPQAACRVPCLPDWFAASQ
jgi:hypothetical protein